MAIAEHPATPDPRIRTIVRSLIQEATSAVRPKMIAGRAWRPTWPSIDRRDAAVLEPRRRPGVALGARTRAMTCFMPAMIWSEDTSCSGSPPAVEPGMEDSAINSSCHEHDRPNRPRNSRG
jgi:hypothetical protein